LDKAFEFLLNEFKGDFDSQKAESIPMPKLLPLAKKHFNEIMEIGMDDAMMMTMDANTNGFRMSFLQTLLHMKEVEEYSYYIFTSSYDE
jgi:hypothetical protein